MGHNLCETGMGRAKLRAKYNVRDETVTQTAVKWHVQGSCSALCNAVHALFEWHLEQCSTTFEWARVVSQNARTVIHGSQGAQDGKWTWGLSKVGKLDAESQFDAFGENGSQDQEGCILWGAQMSDAASSNKLWRRNRSMVLNHLRVMFPRWRKRRLLQNGFAEWVCMKSTPPCRMTLYCLQVCFTTYKADQSYANENKVFCITLDREGNLLREEHHHRRYVIHQQGLDKWTVP